MGGEMTNYVRARNYAAIIRRKLEKALPSLPEGFHNTFNYTQTGEKNCCHPITVALLAEIARQIPGVEHVGIDAHINRMNGKKMQPDVVGWNSDLAPRILMDFESPNSSDARLFPKDIGPYLEWADGMPDAPPYLIITSLPSRPLEGWELRWTSKGSNGSKQYNFDHRDKGDVIRKDPLAYWSKEWRSSPVLAG
jgi:hypothetical protein